MSKLAPEVAVADEIWALILKFIPGVPPSLERVKTVLLVCPPGIRFDKVKAETWEEP